MGEFNLFGKQAEIIIGKKTFPSPPFSMRFELSQTQGSFTKISADLYNPNDETIAASEHRKQGEKTIYTKVTIKAGYKDNFGIIGQGSIKKFDVLRDSTNRILKLDIQDNVEWFNQILNKKFDNTKASVILEDIVGDRPHSISLGVDKLIKHIVVKNIFKSIVQIAGDTNSRFFLRNGTMILEPRGFIPGRAFKIGYENGLVSVPERIDEPEKIEGKKKAFHGFKIQTLFIYGLHLFRAVKIDTPTTEFEGVVTDAKLRFSTFENTKSEYLIAKEI